MIPVNNPDVVVVDASILVSSASIESVTCLAATTTLPGKLWLQAIVR